MAESMADLVISWNQYGEDVQGVGVDGTSDYWQEGDDKIIAKALEAYQKGLSETYAPKLNDMFLLHIAGTLDYSGQFDFGLADERSVVSYWAEMSLFQKGYKVVAGEPYDITVALAVNAVEKSGMFGSVPLADPHLIFAFLPESGNLLGTETDIECNFDEYSVEFIPTGTVGLAFTKKEYTIDMADAAPVALELELKTLTGNGEWISTDGKIASVADGVVTAIAQGTAEIVYVEKYYDVAFSDTCVVTIINSAVSPLPEVETNISYCMGDATSPLTAKEPEGGALTWYDATSAVLESAPVPSSDDAGEQVYFVSQKLDGFEESEKVKISNGCMNRI